MGLFDVFTGDPAKQAAEKNRQLLQDNLTSGTGILNTGQTNALGSLTDAAGAYAPLTNLANQYGQGTTMYLNALGLNGADGTAAAQSAFQEAPGYQYQLGQGLDAINRRRAAGGMLNSGNADQDATNFASGLANQGYNSWLQNLSGLNQNALSATGAAATGIGNANTNKAGVYSNTANSLANLGTNTANGIAGQNTQQANAEMQGSGNLWNFGLNLASLRAGGGLGGLGGGGSTSGLSGGLSGLGTNMMNNGGRFNPIAGIGRGS